MTEHLCHALDNTHFGQNRLPHSRHRCLFPGLPPPQANPLHLVLLVFFLAMRTTGMVRQSEQLTNIFEKLTDQRGRYIFQETKSGNVRKGRRQKGKGRGGCKNEK